MFEIIFVVLLILKLTGNFNKSWWWVFSPLIVEVAIVFAVILAIGAAPFLAVGLAMLHG